MQEIDPEALDHMVALGGTWAAYRNVALDSASVGHLKFLKIGEGCTYKEPPAQYPVDDRHGMGWRYRYVGIVDLTNGEIR